MYSGLGYSLLYSDSGQDSKSEATGYTATEQLSSLSDSTSSTGDSGVHQKSVTVYTVGYCMCMCLVIVCLFDL